MTENVLALLLFRVLQGAKKYLIISANYMAIRISLNNCFRITVISVIFNKTRNFSKKISCKGRAKEFSDVDPRALAKELSGNGGALHFVPTYQVFAKSNGRHYIYISMGASRPRVRNGNE